jgi:hypothetical protein
VHGRSAQTGTASRMPFRSVLGVGPQLTLHLMWATRRHRPKTYAAHLAIRTNLVRPSAPHAVPTLTLPLALFTQREPARHRSL